jgi:hypothetical protein
VDVRHLTRFALPVLLLCCFAWEKANLNPTSSLERYADGIYYFEIAQHVANGDGLRTSVSLYGQGLHDMPAPATVQPLWPLVLGYTGRIFGMERAATGVPEAFYFASLVLLYLLANRLGACLGARDLIRFRGATLLDLGTLAMAIFGRNAVFSAYTSKSYTEGLGFFLLFAALLALPVVATRRVLGRAAAAGALAGLAYLTRSQFALVPLALAAALAISRIGEPRLRGAWLASLAAAGGVVLPWIAFLVTSLPRVPIRVLADFSAYRENDVLPAPEIAVVYEGLADRLLDFLGSFAHAFHPTADHGYAESFGPAALLVPVAFGVAGWQLWRRRREGATALPTGFETLIVLAAFLVAGAALAPAHLSHMAFRREWLFGWRHGLPLVLGIVLALAYLWRFGIWMRAVLLVVVATGIVFRASPPIRYAKDRPQSAAEQALLEWIDGHSRPPVVLSVAGRWLAASSQALIHVPVCTSAEAIDDHIRVLDLDYVVIRASDLRGRCRPLRDIDQSAVALVTTFRPEKSPIWVFRPAQSVPEAGFVPPTRQK